MQPIEQLSATLLARIASYEHARVRYVVAPIDGVPRLVRGSLTFERGPRQEDDTRDYGSAVFIARTIEVEDAKRAIEEIVTRSSSEFLGFSLQSSDKADMPASVRGPVGRHGNVLPAPRTAKRLHAWASEVYSLGPENRNAQHHQFGYGPVVVSGLPIIPDIWEAMTNWTGVDQNGTYDQQNSLLVILPDFRGKLSRLTIGPANTKVEIEVGSAGIERLEIRASTDRGKPARELAVKLNGTVADINAIDATESFLVFLTDSKDGDVIDWAVVADSHGNDGEGIEYTAPSRQIEQRIRGGESDKLEFKSTLVTEQRGGDGHTFIQSVVAFANSRGGEILVGVKDDATICGVDAADREIQRIHDWVETLCEPALTVKAHKIEIDGKWIVAVGVTEGQNKPYQHRGNSIFYVRRGATDRPARRSEVDELYGERNSRPSHPLVGGWR